MQINGRILIFWDDFRIKLDQRTNFSFGRGFRKRKGTLPSTCFHFFKSQSHKNPLSPKRKILNFLFDVFCICLFICCILYLSVQFDSKQPHDPHSADNTHRQIFFIIVNILEQQKYRDKHKHKYKNKDKTTQTTPHTPPDFFHHL